MKQPFARLLVLTAGLLLACNGFLSLHHRQDNAVRRVVVSYEVKENGPADELILLFNRGDPRTTFAEDFDRVVWVYDLGVEEYLELLPPERSYIFLSKIRYDNDGQNAAIIVRRYDGNQTSERILNLQRQEGGWLVSGSS